VKQRFIVFLTCAGLVLTTSSGVCAFKYVHVGMDAPTRSLLSLDGAQVDMQSLAGSRGTVILFWALWSARSLEQLEDLAEAYDTLQAHGVAVVAVSVDKQYFDDALIGAIRAAVEERQLPFPTLLDVGLKLFYEYGVVASPSSAVIDAENRVVYDLAGYSPYAADTMVLTALSRLGVESAGKAEPLALPSGDAMRKFRLGQRLFEKHQLEAALSYFTQAADTDSTFAVAHYYRGLAARRLAQPEIEENALARAVAIEPGNSVFKVALARGRLSRGDTASAIRLLEEAVESDSSYLEGLALLADVYLSTGDEVRCRDCLSRGLAVDAENASLLFVESSRLAHSGDTTGAVTLLRTVLRRLVGIPESP